MSQAELCGLAMHLQYRVPCPTSNALSSRFCSRSWFPLVKNSSDVTLGSWGCSCRALSMASKAWGGVGGSSVRKAHEGSCVLWHRLGFLLAQSMTFRTEGIAFL